MAQVWANFEMKNETKKTTEAQLLDLLKKVLPKATHDPQLAGKDQDDPAMIKAQADLVASQRRAMDLVGALADVQSVAWTLDLRWLSDHGVQAPANAFDANAGR